VFEQGSGGEVLFKIDHRASSLSYRRPILNCLEAYQRRGPEEVKELERGVVLVRHIDMVDLAATWTCKDEGMANNSRLENRLTSMQRFLPCSKDPSSKNQRPSAWTTHTIEQS